MPIEGGHHTTHYILYHTEGCHLCDQAMALLESANVLYALSDICEDQSLVDQYGTRIPVLKNLNSQTELNWPFDMVELSTFTGV